MLFLKTGAGGSGEARNEEVPDEDLCLLAQNGDTDAATRLIERYYQRIYGYLRRESPNTAVAEDLTQQTFMQCWRSIHHFNVSKRFSSWLYRIGHNVLLDWRRRESRWSTASDDWFEDQECLQSAPWADAEEQELAQKAFQAVHQLEAKLRYVVHLHFYQNLNLKEVGEILGISAPAVRYRLHQALKQLRRLLNERIPPHTPLGNISLYKRDEI